MSILKSRVKRIARRSLSQSVYQGLRIFYRDFYPPVRTFWEDFRWQYSWKGHINKRRLCKLHNMYKGKRCFVIGNGPSLTVSDLKRLCNEVTIGCNALFLVFDQINFLPTFYTVEDNLVAEDRARWINKLKGTIKIIPRKLAYCIEQDEYSIYINFLYKYNGFPRFSDRFERNVFWGGTVTFLNLQLAYYIGCREVYLIGIDHNYHTPEKISDNCIIISDSADNNHFHPDYFGKGYRWHDPKIDRMEKAYRGAQEFAAKKGLRIFNATRGGKLEIFPRIDFDRVLEK